MSAADRMQHLTTVLGSFHGRVLAARLGAEGIPVDLRGLSDGPYPLLGEVDVYVRADQLELAREILLADAVDDVFTAGGRPVPGTDPGAGGGPGRSATSGAGRYGSGDAGGPGAASASGDGLTGRPRIHGAAEAAILAVVVLLVVAGVLAVMR